MTEKSPETAQTEAPKPETDRLPNCPRCGHRLFAWTDDGVGTVYLCKQDGLFWIDGIGFSQDEGTLRRDPNVPPLQH